VAWAQQFYDSLDAAARDALDTYAPGAIQELSAQPRALQPGLWCRSTTTPTTPPHPHPTRTDGALSVWEGR
jgi:hypothetical protein